MLDMAYIRVLEVATFYFMFQLQPVGSVAHVQVCGTTSCMICGAEDLIAVCREKIAPHAARALGRRQVLLGGGRVPRGLRERADGADRQGLLRGPDGGGVRGASSTRFARGEVPRPGPQNGRFASEPLGGLTSLTGAPRDARRRTPRWRWRSGSATRWRGSPARSRRRARRCEGRSAGRASTRPRRATPARRWRARAPAGPGGAARRRAPDDLKLIKGVGPELEALLHRLGVFHFDQIAAWTPEEVAWVDANLEGFRGRVTREGWVEQARQLAEEGETRTPSDKIDAGCNRMMARREGRWLSADRASAPSRPVADRSGRSR